MNQHGYNIHVKGYIYERTDRNGQLLRLILKPEGRGDREFLEIGSKVRHNSPIIYTKMSLILIYFDLFTRSWSQYREFLITWNSKCNLPLYLNFQLIKCSRYMKKVQVTVTKSRYPRRGEQLGLAVSGNLKCGRAM